MEYFEEFKTIGLGEETKTFTKDDKSQGRKSMNLKDLEKVNAATRLSLGNSTPSIHETGQAALGLSKSFHEKVILISKHLDSN